VMGHGARSILVGVASGLAMALGATRLVSTMFFGLAAADAATFGEVAVIVAAVSVAACAVPALRLGALAAGAPRV